MAALRVLLATLSVAYRVDLSIHSLAVFSLHYSLSAEASRYARGAYMSSKSRSMCSWERLGCSLAIHRIAWERTDSVLWGGGAVETSMCLVLDVDL